MQSLFVIVLFVFVVGCASEPSRSEPTVKQLWLTKGGNSRPNGDIEDFSLPSQRMDQVFSEMTQARFDREYAGYVAHPLRDSEPDAAFSFLYFESMLGMLEYQRDEARLVGLLASHCPSTTFEPIELNVATRFQNPVEVLEKAYRAAKSSEVRANLVIVFRRMFPDVARGLDDNSVVDGCIQWYLPRKGLLVQNMNYGSQYGLQSTSNRQSQSDLPGDGAFGLFILKSLESEENKSMRKLLAEEITKVDGLRTRK